METRGIHPAGMRSSRTGPPGRGGHEELLDTRSWPSSGRPDGLRGIGIRGIGIHGTAMDTFHYPRVLQALSGLALDASRDGESTTLGKLRLPVWDGEGSWQEFRVYPKELLIHVGSRSPCKGHLRNQRPLRLEKTCKVTKSSGMGGKAGSGLEIRPGAGELLGSSDLTGAPMQVRNCPGTFVLLGFLLKGKGNGIGGNYWEWEP